MFLEHLGKSPQMHDMAYVAPNAVVCGDVTVGENSRILFGAVLAVEGRPVEIGAECVVMENAVVRGTARHPVRTGDRVLIGPHAYLSGCFAEDEAFIATGATVFNGARVGARSNVAVNAVVHIKTWLPENGRVPIGWTAVGDPAEILPPEADQRRQEILDALDFPRTVKRTLAGRVNMREVARRYSRALGRHGEDTELGI